MAHPHIAIIGPGTVGRAIGRLLRRKRYPIAALAGSSPAKTKEAAAFIGGGRVARSNAAAARGAAVVFITTPDRAIRSVCEELAAARAIKRGAAVFHCSGAYGADVLQPVRSAGAVVAALHPVQSFASPEEAIQRMKGTWFTFEGDKGAETVADTIVRALGGTMARMARVDRALYHAALCVLSNYQVALADLGFAMLGLSGMDRGQAAEAAGPLLRGTLENVAALGPAGALTGPIARGDAETIERHLKALRRLPREVSRLYCELGRYTVRLARRKGTLDPAGARRVMAVLDSGRTAQNI
jgi:predicted short-subunit dehydrogenase-like oxidoreductase (DUF2520 family)